MNTVPFEQLGPGQSGRLAYQVLGQNGPIFNPQNIRYLPPDSPEIPANPMAMGESGLSAGLAGANLIGSILNLGVSLYIAHRINDLHEKMDHLQEIMDRVEQKIDYIVAKVDRIDTQVAENNLRHALNHVLQKAVSLEGIDLRFLAGFHEDLSVFNNSLSSPLISNFGLRLSSDVRDRLQMIYDLLYGIRKFVAQRHNFAIYGDSERVIAITPTLEYFELLGRPLETMVKENMLFEKVIDELAIHKEDMLGFSIFSDEEFSECEDGHRDRLVELFDNAGFIDLCPNGLFLSDLFMDEAPEVVEQGLYDLCCAWLHNTDAGLLWRTWIELEGIADGYENVFWPQLKEAEPCGINQIEVACDVPLLENT